MINKLRNNNPFLLITGIFIFLFSFFTCQRPQDDSLPALMNQYERIISLSPSTTEILFELGLGEKIIGVSNFCNYPEAARQKQRLGGFLDPNFEAIASLQPDLVLLLPEQENVRLFLSQLKLNYLIVDNKTIADILEAISTIGKTCHVPEAAARVLEHLQNRIQIIQNRTRHLPQPAVLVSIGRSLGNGTLADVYAAGGETFYTELITKAGGKNVLAGNAIPYPLLTAEGIIELNPDIIIDITFGLDLPNMSLEKIKLDWNSVSTVRAVQKNQIYILNESYTVIPGPRFIILLEHLARIIHPEVDWEKL